MLLLLIFQFEAMNMARNNAEKHQSQIQFLTGMH